MNRFLALQHTYKGIEVALFKDNEILEKIYDDKRRASKYIISMINSVLEKNDLKILDLDFIAANQGPGPFTTLRVVIATVNGLGFATKKPLIGVDGLDALLEEYHDNRHEVTVALLDAFAQDIYFGIEDTHTSNRVKGYKNISVLLAELKASFSNIRIKFLGNGAEKYRHNILEYFGQKAVFPDFLPLQCSVGQVGRIALNTFKKGQEFENQLLPIYLKDFVVKVNGPSSF